MVTAKYDIAFEFLSDNGSFRICLQAEVEENHSDLFYVIKNFRMGDSRGSSLLPDIELIKKAGSWVHRDSGKETNLSLAIGEAIEKRKKEKI